MPSQSPRSKRQQAQRAAAQQQANGPSLLGRIGRLFGYDSAQSDKARKNPAVPLRSEDSELSIGERNRLTGSARDVIRNYAVAQYLLTKHLDYTTGFTFQARTGNDDLDDQLEAFIRHKSKAENLDASGRHGLDRLLRIIEARRVIDGDAFILTLNSGLLQIIESDRVRDSAPTWAGSAVSQPATIHGVAVDRAGKATGYMVHDRDGSSFVNPRLVRAKYILQHGWFESRYDQVRGISPLTTALNALKDSAEATTYALVRSKISQLFGIAFTRNSDRSLGEESTDTETDYGYSVDLSKGSFVLDLDPGDKAEFLESAQPSTQFQQFLNAMIQQALKALSIPMCLYDEQRTNFSGSRMALKVYEQSCQTRRDEIRQFVLEPLTRWWIMLAVMDGDLELSAEQIDNLSFEWVSRCNVPWAIDPGKESAANKMDVDNGFTSRQRIAKQQGEDFFQIVDELAAENAYLQAKGVALPGASVPISQIIVDQPTDQPNDPVATGD